MDEHVLTTYLRSGPVYVAGRGATLVDEDGGEHLDLLSGIGVNALGHAHPRWVEAVRDQAGRLAHLSNLFRHPYTEEVARRLARLSGLDAVFFSNSGSEANECAIKLARKAQRLAGHPERTSLVALEGGFHGRTAGSLALTANAAYREPFAPLLEVRHVPRHDLPALEEALAAAPAALFLEPLQGESGLVELGSDYLRAARRLCDATGTLLVADEVQCGTGRTGTFLAIERAGVLPDVATLAKPLAGGLPIGATLVSRELAATLQPGDHGSTFGGGPLVLRAALVVLEELKEGGLLEAVSERGADLERALDGMVARHPGVRERRGAGLMQGLVVPGAGERLRAAALERGLVCGTAGPDVLRLLPPYVIQPDELQRACALLDAALADVLPTPPRPRP